MKIPQTIADFHGFGFVCTLQDVESFKPLLSLPALRKARLEGWIIEVC
jgi:hypothetical protein